MKKRNFLWRYCLSVIILFLALLFPDKKSLGAQIPDWLVDHVKASERSNPRSGMGKITLNLKFTEYGRLVRKERKEKLKGKRVKPPHLVEKDRTPDEIFLAFEGPKIRFDRKFAIKFSDRSVNTFDVRQAFDGEKGTVMNLNRRQGEIPMPRGQIVPQLHVAKPYDPRKWGTVFGTDEKLSNLLCGEMCVGNLYKETTVELLGKENINGIECYVVKARFKNLIEDREEVTAKLWVNPKRNFQVTRVLTKRRVPTMGRDFSCLTDIKYKDYGNGVWFPQKGVCKAYVFDEPTGEDKLYYTQIRTVSEDFKINVDVPDSFFEISFVKGQKVYDVRTGKIITWPGK